MNSNKLKSTRYHGLFTREQEKGSQYVYRGTSKFIEVYGDKYVVGAVADYTAAQAKAECDEKEIECQKPNTKSKLSLTASKLMDKYLEDEDRRFRQNKITYGTYGEKKWLIHKYLRPAFGELTLGELEYCKDRWNNFTDEHDDLDLRNHRKVFKAFLNWAIAEEYIDRLPKLDITFKPWREGKDLGMETIWEMHEVCRNQDLKDFIAISAMTGMRKMEVLGLSRDRIKEINSKLRSVKTKDHPSQTKKIRVIAINETVWQIIQRRVKANPDSCWVFPHGETKLAHLTAGSLHKTWDRLCQELNLEDVRINDIRTTFANETERLKLPEALRDRHMGHSRRVAEKHYEKLKLEDCQVIADAIDLKSYKPNRDSGRGW